MATPKAAVQDWIAQLSPLHTLNEALNLAHRYREGEGFRAYVRDRMRLVIPATVLIFVISLACTVATVVFLAGTHFLLTLLALVLVPLVLLGSLLVQLYTFFSWLEGRALARALRHRTHTLPPVPWVMAALVLFAPLAMLASVDLKAAIVLIVLAVLTPILFARLDR